MPHGQLIMCVSFEDNVMTRKGNLREVHFKIVYITDNTLFTLKQAIY